MVSTTTSYPRPSRTITSSTKKRNTARTSHHTHPPTSSTIHPSSSKAAHSPSTISTSRVSTSTTIIPLAEHNNSISTSLVMTTLPSVISTSSSSTMATDVPSFQTTPQPLNSNTVGAVVGSSLAAALLVFGLIFFMCWRKRAQVAADEPILVYSTPFSAYQPPDRVQASRFNEYEYQNPSLLPPSGMYEPSQYAMKQTDFYHPNPSFTNATQTDVVIEYPPAAAGGSPSTPHAYYQRYEPQINIPLPGNESYNDDDNNVDIEPAAEESPEAWRANILARIPSGHPRPPIPAEFVMQLQGEEVINEEKYLEEDNDYTYGYEWEEN